MANIASIKPADHRTLEIINPGTGQPLGVRVRVMSIEDERLKKIKRVFSDERFKLESKGKALKTEDVERNGERLLFGATLGWDWYNPTGNEGDEGYDADAMPGFDPDDLDAAGEVPEYNQRNFTALVRALPWFAEQIHEEIGETKAFFDNSKQN